MIRILSLDDTPEMVALYGLILGRAGYEYVGTSDSGDAWEMLHAEPFDLFTQDLMRPDIDGSEFYGMIKSDPALCDLPMMIMSARALDVEQVSGLGIEGVDAYVTLPVGPLELLAAVEYVLRKHGKSPPAQDMWLSWLEQSLDKEYQEIGPLILALLDRAEEKRQMAVQAAHTLGEMGDERAIEPLIEVLQDRDSHWNVRSAAARALARIGGPRVVEPLIAALKNGVRDAAALALGGLGDSRAVQPLIAVLRDVEHSGHVSAAAVWALGNLRDERAVTPLVEILYDEPAGNVWWVVTRSLAQIGTPAVELLVEWLLNARDGHIRQVAVELLGQIGDGHAVEPLIAALRDGSEDVRRTAAWYLGNMADQRAVEPLIVSLRDDDADVRAAIRSLGRLGDTRAVEPLVAMLQDARVDVVWRVCDALGKLGDARAIPHLERVAREDARTTRHGGAIADVARHAIEQIETMH
jgi:HEAT repeat protein/CheY-like chemotaxis protein